MYMHMVGPKRNKTLKVGYRIGLNFKLRLAHFDARCVAAAEEVIRIIRFIRRTFTVQDASQ